MSDREDNIVKIMGLYVKLAIQHREGTIEGNHRKTNRAYDKLVGLFNKFQEDDTLAEEIITACLLSDDVRVRTLAAAHSLGLRKHVAEAEKVLEEAANMKDIGILRFNAEMTLKVWREQGYLKF